MLEELLVPQSIAVIGASRTPGKVGHDILANLLAGGFAGPIVPVNPAADRVLDLTCYPSLKAYGSAVDLVVIVVPVATVVAAVREAVAAGARALVVISAGFKETGPAGLALERQIVAICASRRVRLLGPNCLGLINTACALNASFAGSMPKAGGISVFSQSGALCTAILDLAAARNLGLAKVVSIGNKADITEVDLLRALGRDEATRAIVGYLEDIGDGDAFVKAAEDAASIKPVIILKSGTTAAGRQAVASHTGVLAGVDTAYAAAFKRAGVIRADTFEALFDYGTALSMQPLPKGNRVLIITNAGGPGTMAADALERLGLQVAVLGRNTATALRSKLPEAASIGNPVDVLGDAEPERYGVAMAAAMEDPEVDAVLVILTPQAMTKPRETARVLIDNMRGDKPILAVFMGGEGVVPGRDELLAAGLPCYSAPERAVASLQAMCEYSAWRRRPPRVVTRFRVHRRRVERIIARRQRTGHLLIGEVKGKDILRAYGFRTPDGYLAVGRDEAVEIAERIGFPVAMKIVSPDIIHKSDLGGVRLNINNGEAVLDAFELMLLRIGQRAPKARVEGIYVEKMVDRGLEVIIGMSRDPQFGPMLMFGLGGIFVEVMKDVTFHLAPITAEEAIQMLKTTRSYEILEGRRGQRGVDLEAIAVGLQRISQLTTDFPEIIELDINPFIVGDPGTEPCVADVRMTLRPSKNPESDKML
ncbi:MAG: acyl-CoA synthetase [Deltaproteobacteria bacterium RIFOXYD12_FULL_57_12]|nr:MAG: acyl-CoA synthetase [Deltaproteobacteria bacterium RIFOXYD12_FULL_57_12]